MSTSINEDGIGGKGGKREEEKAKMKRKRQGGLLYATIIYCAFTYSMLTLFFGSSTV